MQAKDIMTINVISVSEDTPVHEVVGLLLKHRISALPVVDSARKVVGIVSEGDLLRPEGASRAGTRRPWWLEAVFAGQVAYEKVRPRSSPPHRPALLPVRSPPYVDLLSHRADHRPRDEAKQQQSGKAEHRGIQNRQTKARGAKWPSSLSDLTQLGGAV
jgi:hypothetical protein